MTIDKNMLEKAISGKASCNQIGKHFGISHNTVRRARRLLLEAHIRPEMISNMSDTELKLILYPSKNKSTYKYPDCKHELEYLDQGYTLQEAHAMYVEEVGSDAAIGYSAYCDRMQQFRESQKTEFRHSHAPGEEMQIDYGGKRPVGKENGRKRKFEIFVAVFPASHFIFAICTRTQSASATIEASINALEFYGGTPQKIVSDNLKAVVISRANKTPIINVQYRMFADYYGTLVAPTRVASPTDKASVEVAVKLVQNALNARLRGKPPLELHELNQVLVDVVDELNLRPMKRNGETRLERFQRLDQPLLEQLPSERMTFIDVPVERRVPRSYHVSVDNAYYSVPSNLVGQMVQVRKSSKKIEIRHDGLPVAIHRRSYRKGQFVTTDAHRPENHLAFVERQFKDWMDGLPKSVQDLVQLELQTKQPGRQRLEKRVNRLVRDYGIERVEKACNTGMSNGSPNLTHVTNLLRNNREDVSNSEYALPSGTFRPARNVRGSTYFGRQASASGGAS